MRFYRLTPIETGLGAAAWQRSTEQRDCCIAACCEAAARQAASTLYQPATLPDVAKDLSSPWLLARLVACEAIAEVPACTTDPRLSAVQRSGRLTSLAIDDPAPRAAAPGTGSPPGALPGNELDASVFGALARIAEGFAAAGHADEGQRLLGIVAGAWSSLPRADREAARLKGPAGLARREDTGVISAHGAGAVTRGVPVPRRA